MRPIVAEVEDVDELLAGLKATEPCTAIVSRRSAFLPVLVERCQTRPVGEVEVMHVGAIPTGERVVDSLGELGEGVGAGGREDPAGPRPEVLAMPGHQIHLNRKPCACHAL